MYPSTEKPYSGVFVKNQYLFLKEELGLDIEIFYMKRKITGKLGSIVKYLLFYIRFINILFKKYDLIHLHFLGKHFFLSIIYKLLYSNVAILTTIHGSDIRFFAKKAGKKLAQKYIDSIISVSKFQATQLKEKYGIIPNHILPAGISRDIFFFKDIKKKQFDFIFVGSLFKIKGIDIFLNSLTKVHNHLKVCIVGTGDKKQEILKFMSRTDMPNITYYEHKSQDELCDLYNNSKFLVLPSRGDSFGLVVTEALFCGCPVIVSNSAGTMEQVKDSHNGFVIDPNSDVLAELIDNLSHLKKEEYENLSLNARNSNSHYSLDHICKKLNEIYLAYENH